MKSGLSLITLLLAAATVLIVGIEASSAKPNWTPDDLLLAENAGSFSISPDGRWVVWIKSQMDKKKGNRISNVFLTDLDSGSEIELTRGTFSHSSPKWAPDGKTIAFLSARPGPDESPEKPTTGLWLINPRGGEPWQLTSLKRAVRSFSWRDEKTILFSAQEDPSLYELGIKERKDTTRIIEDAEHEPPVRIFQIDVKSKRLTRITHNHDWIQGINVSPDGRWVASVHQRSLSFTFDHKVTPAIFLTNLDSGEATEIEPGKRIVPRGLTWANDSSGFYYAREYSSDPKYFTASITLLRFYSLSVNASIDVDLGWPNGLGGFRSSVQATPDGFVALLADGVRFKAARYRKNGDTWTMSPLEGEHIRNLFSWVLGKDGRTLVYDHSTATKPTQLYQAQLKGNAIEDARQITHLNPAFNKKPLSKSEVISWRGANGDLVEGVLYYPLNYKKGKRYPLMLSIHGGPAGADMDAWRESYGSPKPILNEKGAFVLKVNYHGSGNYGLEWVESICCGRYYDLERVDIENGVDFLIEKGLVDPDKLGTMGWSNGAILTTELVTRSRRYKVASAGAGDVEWISDWGNVMFGASFDNYYFGKPPYEDPDFYIKKSPYFRLKDVTTPTILYTGTDDVNVPPSQSWSHYRVLQQATKTPVRLVIFPGEPHGLRKYQHQKRKLEEDLAWFDKYLFQTAEEKNPSIKPGSPLDQLLRIRLAHRSGYLYGIRKNGILVPETVEYKDLGVGQFEVTRAQYSEFDDSFLVKEGTGNFPASGITFEEASAYVEWLSQKTGEPYRLPGVADSKLLYDAKPQSENTLDFWSGYSPSFDDVVKLREELSSVGEEGILLKEVGQFKGQGEDRLVFDLGGNVAEWIVVGEGEGRLEGGSADLPSNYKVSLMKAGKAYRGFRVVRGKLESNTQ